MPVVSAAAVNLVVTAQVPRVSSARLSPEMLLELANRGRFASTMMGPSPTAMESHACAGHRPQTLSATQAQGFIARLTPARAGMRRNLLVIY